MSMHVQAIEAAIEAGLPRVEAGAQGEHKISRGYLPAFTYSAHYLREGQLASGVAQFLRRESIELGNTWKVCTWIDGQVTACS